MFDSIKGILFDMDGTVLDSEALFDNAQLLFLKEFEIDAKIKDLEEFKGMSYKDFYPRFTDKFKLTVDVDVIRFKIRTYLHDIMETRLKFIDGFEHFFNHYIQPYNFQVGLVTNTTRLSYQKIQKCINIDDYFKYVITVTEAIEPKPSPEPYFQAMDYLSLNANNTLIIEDSNTGLTSAVKTGAKVIGLTTSLNEKQIQQINKNIIIVNTYQDIGAYFEKNF